MIETYTEFEQFKKKAQEMGVGVNLSELLEIQVTFLESYEEYVIINIKTTGESPNNILILNEKNALLYSDKTFGEKDYKMFRYTLQKPFGESTVLAFLALRSVLSEYEGIFKIVDEKTDGLEKKYEIGEAEEATSRLRRLTNRVEDFVNLMMSLEERKIRQVNTSLIAYDYGLVLAKAQHLLDRCRNHLNQLRDIQRDADVRQMRETNKRIEDLTNVMKKLTAITVILMIPTAIASHFGMNFRYMPELSIPEAYPAVVVGQIILTVAIALYLKWKGWL